ncbi:transposase [Streptomyces sp. NPDC001635]
MSRSYSAEFRCRVLDQVDAGRTIRQIAQDLGISKQTIYVWRRQHFIEPDGCPDRPEAIKQNSWPHGDGSPHWRRKWPSTTGQRN